MRLWAGDKVDRYVIVEPIGAGGMGEVYRALDERLQRTVALKVIAGDPTPGSEESAPGSAAARLVREARLAAALEHPNIVAVYDVGTATEGSVAGMPYLAMELINGRTLKSYLRDARVSLSDRLRWLADVARALQAAHARGLVHRDMKPDNVMIREDGTVKVLDFGIALRTRAPPSSVTGSARAAVGTPRYMSPEQLQSETLDGRSDQFSWGFMAYELLGGESPWPGDDVMTAITKMLTEDPAPLSSRAPDLPRGVTDVVMRALERDREKRHASMAPIVLALDSARASLERGHVVEVDRTETAATMPIVRLSGRTTVAAAAALCAVIGLAWGALASRPARRDDGGAAAVAAPAQDAGASDERTSSCPQAGGKWRRKASGTCVRLDSEDCAVFASDRALASDATLWIGSMYPLTGEGTWGQLDSDAIDLARQEIDKTLGQLPSSPKQGGARPVGLISCDDLVAPERAAQHLVDVGAPVVLGFGGRDEVIHLAASFFTPNHVLVISTENTGDDVTRPPPRPGEPRLVWRTMYSASQSVPPVARFVSEVLEPQIRREGKGAIDRIRVANVHASAGAGLALAEATFHSLVFNGKSALDNGADYLEISWAGPQDDDAVVAALAAFAPHVVIHPSADWIPALEARLAGRSRPRYVAPSINCGDVIASVAATPDARRRVFGLTSVSSRDANVRFTLRFNEVFPDHPVTRIGDPNSTYDAAYVSIYAAIAAGDGVLDGVALARGIDRLRPPGVPITVGPADALRAFDRLRRGESIDLSGSIGSLDFDPATGEAPVDLAILCVAPATDAGPAREVESGLVFDAKARAFTGSLRCP